MWKIITKTLLVGIALGAWRVALPALDLVNDDTDIFMVNPAVSSQRPNVLIMLDNSSNWGQSSTGTPKFDNEQPALASVVGSLTDQFNLGLMMFLASNDDNSLGGYMRYGIRQMSGSANDATTNKGRLVALVNALEKVGDNTSSALTYSHGMYEAYKYFQGQNSPFGYRSTPRDYTNNPQNTYVSGLADNPLTSSTDQSYTSPVVAKCQKNFIIILSNGKLTANQRESDAFTNLQGINSSASELTPTTSVSFPTVGGSTDSAIPDSGRWADEYANWMANNDCAPITGTQPVYTYVVEVDPGTQPQDKQFSAWLYQVAKEGKGKYIPVTNNADEIRRALDAVFLEIQAVNSVFASTTLPVSNNFRGTNLNQVYIGMFRPDGNRLPRWYGNLKMYKVGSNLDQLVDAHTPEQPAYNSATGFLFNTAISFWTTSSTFWSFRGPNYDSSDAGRQSDSPDGDLVEKGGAGQRLRVVYPTADDIATRKVYTCTGSCTGGSSLSDTPFATSNADITAGSLGAYTTIPITSLTSSVVAGTATATATTQSAHGFGSVGSSVSGISIFGASPTNYNGTYTISVTGANTFTYTLPNPPSAITALVRASNHSLNIGDLVTVTGATPAGYNVTDVAVQTADFSTGTFSYAMGAAESNPASGYTITGKRTLASGGGTVSGTAGTSTATVYFPNHGYSSSPAGGVTIAGANEAAFNVTGAAITVDDGNNFRYTTASSLTSNATTTTVTVTAANHGFGTAGQTVSDVVIAGAVPVAFNGTYTITIVDANTFTYVINSVQGTAPTGTITAAKPAGTVNVALATLVNGTSNGTKCDFTATTASAHGLVSGTANISGNTPTGFNNTSATITVTSPTRFTYSKSGCGLSASTAVTTRGTVSQSTAASTKTLSTVVPAVNTVIASGAITISSRISATSVSVQTSANTTNALVGNTSAGDATLRASIINWVRGVDNKEDENRSTTYTDVRASIHGDVLHSRPAVVNYNRYGNDNDVVIYYGTNDGLLRAAKGGFGEDGGNEAWSFVAPEFFSKLKRQRDNSPSVSGAVPRDYFFDGSTVVYTKDTNQDGKIRTVNNDKAYIYSTMRRGGRMIYAFDVTDPDNPILLWKKGCPNINNNTGCSAGWSEIGQTWSEPKIGYIRAHSNPVLIFGAGYDPLAEDHQPCLVTNSGSASVTGYKGGALTYLANGACWMTSGTSTTNNRTMGRGIFIVDAFTGDIVWRVGAADVTDASTERKIVGMSFAIPADVSVLNRDQDRSRTVLGTESVNEGYLDRVYAVDTGGNVWRLDIDNPDKSYWAVNKVAGLSGAALADKRKFLYAPRVVYDPACGTFDALVIGSGDREHPFSAGYYADPSVAPGNTTPTYFRDRYYMVKDLTVGLINPQGTTAAQKQLDLSMTTVTEDDLYDASTNCVQVCASEQDRQAAANLLKTERGWFFAMRSGEKVVSSSTVSAGVVIFQTNQPKGSAGDDSCGSDLGVAREYRVNFCDARVVPLPGQTSLGPGDSSDRGDKQEGGGFRPNPTPTIPCVNGKCQEVICIGADCKKIVKLKLNDRKRTYWYKKTD